MLKKRGPFKLFKVKIFAQNHIDYIISCSYLVQGWPKIPDITKTYFYYLNKVNK
jgi:hypothetical protein